MRYFAYLEIEIIYIHSFREFINRQHPKIEFTYELESFIFISFISNYSYRVKSSTSYGINCFTMPC